MPGAVAKAKDEVREILVVALFFSTGFCLIHVANRLLTEGSSVELATLTRAIFGGLIVAKVLLVVDLLPFVHAFPDKPLIQNIAWKSWLYVAGALIFLYIEPFLKSLFKGVGLSASLSRAWQELMLPRTWATVIALAMLLIGFVTIKELTRVIGKDEMKRIFFHGQSQSPGEKRFRDAA
jgi:hypothetical protein